jgi:hypothetical protein
VFHGYDFSFTSTLKHLDNGSCSEIHHVGLFPYFGDQVTDATYMLRSETKIRHWRPAPMVFAQSSSGIRTETSLWVGTAVVIRDFFKSLKVRIL